MGSGEECGMLHAAWSPSVHGPWHHLATAGTAQPGALGPAPTASSPRASREPCACPWAHTSMSTRQARSPGPSRPHWGQSQGNSEGQARGTRRQQKGRKASCSGTWGATVLPPVLPAAKIYVHLNIIQGLKGFVLSFLEGNGQREKKKKPAHISSVRIVLEGKHPHS